jgi:hypothetical protein
MNKASRTVDSAASTTAVFASWRMRLARYHAKTATSLTVVMDVAHVDPGIVVDDGVAEILPSRLSSHVARL